MEKLKQVDAGYEFNKEGYGWSETVITDESVLAVLEMRYGIQIALLECIAKKMVLFRHP